MNIYLIKENETLEEMQQSDFSSERDIQRIVENNLETIFSYDFIESEFSLGNFRIDTLAYDSEINSFVIIEYKNRRSSSVIDQGYSYLSLLLNNKSEILLKYASKTQIFLSKSDVNWNQSKVIFISPNFNKYQLESVNFRDIPFELWEIQKFNDDIITLNQLTDLGKSKSSVESIENISEDKAKVNEEVKVYSEEYHLKNMLPEIADLYEELRDNILDISSKVKPKFNKRYIAFNNGSFNFCNVVLTPRGIRLILKMETQELDDGKGTFSSKSKTGGYAPGNYETILNSNEDIEYIISCVKQAFKDSNQIRDNYTSRKRETYAEEDHLNGVPNVLQETYNTIRNHVVENIPNVDIKVTKGYIGFNNGRRTFLSVVLRDRNIRLYLNTFEALSDPKGQFKEVPRVGGYAAGNYEIVLTHSKNHDIEYVLEMIEEVANST